MKTNTRSFGKWSRAASWVLGIGAISTLSTSGCLTRPLEKVEPGTTWTATFKQTSGGVDKIDLLLMLDNSRSMADKQAILNEAVPQLVKGLLNPRCLDSKGNAVASQPSATQACPTGSAREFQPVSDVHIGILTSSLGAHGISGWCDTATGNDKGHLVDRADAATPDQPLPTYRDKGFLAWDPNQDLTPPGDGDIDAIAQKLEKMVNGVGQDGCGLEAQLESWYRFLVEPSPQVNGADDDGLIKERAEFLRPDSMVAVLMLTDENDCSFRDDGDNAQRMLSVTMPRPRAVCATNPDDPCCAPCDKAPAGCAADPSCTTNGGVLTAAEDPGNLRCFDQKHRFGRDFLHPVQRYVDALGRAEILGRDGKPTANPLYPADPDGSLNARRPEQGLVFLAGIVGVPWQDIARQRADGTPDLVHGLDKDNQQVGGFMSAKELSDSGRWDVILGDPRKGVSPRDALMIESREPRKGTSPIVNASLAPTTSNSPTANPVNGHEWNTSTPPKGSTVPAGDLQYACTFPLKTPRACTGSDAACDCVGADTNGSDNPLCQDESGVYSTTQRRAKAYPGLRQLEVIRDAGEQGIVASICPAQLDDADPNAKDYGYNPAIGAIIERLKQRLLGQCLNRAIKPDSDGHVSCLVIEAKKSDAGGACCEGKARSEVPAAYAGALQAVKSDPFAAGEDCFCQIDQLSDAPLAVCQNDASPVPVDASGAPVNGWCYVDESVGKSELVSACPSTERQKIRFVGAGQPGGDAHTFIMCASGN